MGKRMSPYRLTIIASLTLGSLLTPIIIFADEAASATSKTANNNIEMSVAHGMSIDSSLTINNIKYPINIYANWSYKPSTPMRNYLNTDQVRQNINNYLAEHTKNTNKLEALSYDLAYTMLGNYSQLQSFTVTINLLSNQERIVSDYSSVTASYHK